MVQPRWVPEIDPHPVGIVEVPGAENAGQRMPPHNIVNLLAKGCQYIQISSPMSTVLFGLSQNGA